MRRVSPFTQENDPVCDVVLLEPVKAYHIGNPNLALILYLLLDQVFNCDFC